MYRVHVSVFAGDDEVQDLVPITLLSFVDVRGVQEYARGVQEEREARERGEAEGRSRKRCDRATRILLGVRPDLYPSDVFIRDVSWKEEGDLEDEGIQYYYGSRFDVAEEFNTDYALRLEISGRVRGREASARLEFSAHQDMDVGDDKVYLNEDEVEDPVFDARAEGFGSRSSSARLLEGVFESLAGCGRLATETVVREIRAWADDEDEDDEDDDVL